jgi:hypothetical protein
MSCELRPMQPNTRGSFTHSNVSYRGAAFLLFVLLLFLQTQSLFAGQASYASRRAHTTEVSKRG